MAFKYAKGQWVYVGEVKASIVSAVWPQVNAVVTTSRQYIHNFDGEWKFPIHNGWDWIPATIVCPD